MTSPFVCVGDAEWKLSDTLDLQRRRWLLDSPPYDQLVHNILRGLSGVEVKRERSTEKPGYYRAVVTLHVDAAALDQFHSSASGYRAQYYENPALGSKANRFALDILLPRVRELVADCNKRTCPASWVAQSLQDSDAKLWIHQGLWLRQARKSDRNLLVARWLARQDCSVEKIQKLVKWSMLTPADEKWLELRGAFCQVKVTHVEHSNLFVHDIFTNLGSPKSYVIKTSPKHEPLRLGRHMPAWLTFTIACPALRASGATVWQTFFR